MLDRNPILRRRVIVDLFQGHTPHQISAPPARLSVWHTAHHGYFPRRPQCDPPRGDLHGDLCPPKKTLIEHGICLPSRR